MDPYAECQNCARTVDKALADKLEERGIPHLYERVAPGEVMPVCECPDCGALMHLITEE